MIRKIQRPPRSLYKTLCRDGGGSENLGGQIVCNVEQFYVGCSRVGREINLKIMAPDNKTVNVVYKEIL